MKKQTNMIQIKLESASENTSETDDLANKCKY